jgi:hypothetical protein
MKFKIYHQLGRCVNGWTESQISKLDVTKVLDIKYTKRLYPVFNKDYPFILKIEYDKPIVSFLSLSFTHHISKFYKTEEECKFDINEILKKKKKIYSSLHKLKIKNRW